MLTQKSALNHQKRNKSEENQAGKPQRKNIASILSEVNLSMSKIYVDGLTKKNADFDFIR